MKAAAGRRKHVPLRNCIACRRKRPKREMMRIVRTPEGTLEIDLKGKRPGRGAYLCRDRRCLEAGLDPARLKRALECDVTSDQIAALRDVAESLVVEEGDAGQDGLPA